jgi:hypothetical protein
MAWHQLSEHVWQYSKLHLTTSQLLPCSKPAARDPRAAHDIDMYRAAGLTSIEPQWLPEVAAPLCEFSEPLADPAPTYRAGSDQVSQLWLCFKRAGQPWAPTSWASFGYWRASNACCNVFY